jgi:hypothetical protein
MTTMEREAWARVERVSDFTLGRSDFSYSFFGALIRSCIHTLLFTIGGKGGKGGDEDDYGMGKGGKGK